MPESGPRSIANRVEGTLSGVHPRRNGDLVPLMDDVMEQRGDFVHKDASGNPEGLKIVRVENPDGWDALVGTSSGAELQQNSAPLLITRPSFVDDQPFVNGPPAPGPNDSLAAKIPQAQTPLLKVVKAAIHGYPGTTAQKPMWYQYCWIKNGNLTLPSPPVPFQIGNGQGVTVGWADPSSTVDGVALFLSEPGTSSATSPGPMREQERLFFSSYKLKTRDLSGPYRNGRLAPTTNETLLSAPALPPDAENGTGVTLEQGGYVVVSDYHFYVSVATPQGESGATLVRHFSLDALGGGA